MMLEDNLHDIYLKLKLYYYRRIFRKISDSEADSLTALEAFCAEAIYGLGHPTLTEFANFINVSQPNAAYKVANLEKKGYVKKTKSSEDGRIVHLSVTDKFLQIYGTSERYVSILTKRLKRKYSEEEIEKFSEIMADISDNMMTEVNRYLRHKAELPEGTIPEKD
ncbi:MAG: MarR family transcriptional regulator [Eubacteriales bacterium]|nr:MarR family transcriptional regulator [Eubacteriales bacterium]MDD4541709.1 MarR family transcriptional regulator [Eubacteriales bacterium]